MTLLNRIWSEGRKPRRFALANHFAIYLVLVMPLFLQATEAFAQIAEVSRRVLPVAEVKDLSFLSQFLEEQFISPENPDYTSAAFLDVTRDGFGSNDLLILHPGEEYFQLSEYLPERMINVLSAQNLATDYNLSTVQSLSRVIADEAEEEEDPKKALAGAFLRSLLVYYPAGNFQGYIDQIGEDVRISFWGYEEDQWHFAPEATQCIQPDDDPLILVVHKQRQIQSFLDVDGCVVIQASTTGAEVSSRVCE